MEFKIELPGPILEIPADQAWGRSRELICIMIPNAVIHNRTNNWHHTTDLLPFQECLGLGCALGNIFLSWHIPSLTSSGLPAQAKKHAQTAKSTLLAWKRNIISDKEKKEILQALVMLYYTLGISWLLQNQYPFFPKCVWWLRLQATCGIGGWKMEPPVHCVPTSKPSLRHLPT